MFRIFVDRTDIDKVSRDVLFSNINTSFSFNIVGVLSTSPRCVQHYLFVIIGEHSWNALEKRNKEKIKRKILWLVLCFLSSQTQTENQLMGSKKGVNKPINQENKSTREKC